MAELTTKYESRPTQIAAWKREAIEKLVKVFDEKGAEREKSRDGESAPLHAKIGQRWGGYLYLVAIMDWVSRKVLSWRLSNTITIVDQSLGKSKLEKSD